MEEPEEWEAKVELGPDEDADGDTEEQQAWFDIMCMDDSTPEIPLDILHPCKAPVQLQKSDESGTVEIKAYYDPGASGNFIHEDYADKVKQEDILPSNIPWVGAIEGETGETFLAIMSIKGSNVTIRPRLRVIPRDQWKFGKDVGILLGLPSLAKTGAVMSINPKDFIIFHRKLRLLQKISQDGKVLESRKIHDVASVTREEMGDDELLVNRVTIHPEGKDWEKKLHHLEPKLRSKTLSLLMKYKYQFWLQGYLPPLKDVMYSIKYEGPPFRDPMIPLTQDQRKYIIPIFEEQVEQGVLGEVKENTERLNYVSNMFLKVESDKMRPCINYKKLNEHTVKTNMPIPNKETMLARLAGADSYITMDAKAAYNQLPVAEESQKYMVFVVPGLDGHPRYFYPKRSNFGSSNMPGEFQRLSGGIFEAASAADGVYIDDVTIKCTEGADDEALTKLEEVLRRAKDKGVTFAFKKTHLFEKEVKILGEILSKAGRKPNPARIRVLRNWPAPKTRRELRSFLGLYNFLAPLKRHATAPPIVAMQKYTNTSVKYDKEAVLKPFEEAKGILCRWLLLHAYDPTLETFVLTDSSDSGMGAVLMQVTKYGLRAIAVCSKKWPTRKKEYAAHVKEGMALVTGMRRFEHLLKHTNVTMVTDSENTVDLFTNPDWNQVPSLWLRWRRYLAQSFRVSILHIPGKLNIAADVLSRQTYTVASVAASWAHEETFFSPLMRSIYDEQQKDPELLAIMESLKSKQEKPKKLPKMYYTMDNGLLKQVHFRFGKQIVIPKSLVPTILYLEHDVPLKGHPGEAYMRIALKQHYWWTGMDDDVHEYVKSCKGCQLSKARLDHSALSNAIRQTSSIFSVFSMDLIDMNTISASYRYIMVMMDYYSSFILLTNLRDKKATSILKAMWDCFTLFGPPEALLSDRGREFVNKLAKSFTEEIGVQHVLTYAYRPQANGRNERSHAVIQNSLRIFAESKPASWHQYTARLQYMFNTRAKPETGISPYQILFGLKPRSLHNTSPFLEYDHAEMKNMRATLNEVVRKHQLKQLHARATPPAPAFQVGDKVILNRKFPLRAKRYFPAMGPYEVIEKVSNSGYHLRHLETGEEKRNVSRAHLYTFTEREGGSAVPPIVQQPEKQQNDSGDTEAEQAATESLALDMKEAEQIEEELKKKEDVETKQPDQPPKKKKRALARLNNFNEAPAPVTLKEDLEVGNMVVLKQEGAARLGEVIDLKEEEITLHWYGSSSARSLPRNRWKLYPGWETEDGTIEYSASQAGGLQGGKAATCDVKREDIYLVFNRLTIKSELPADVLKKIEKLIL